VTTYRLFAIYVYLQVSVAWSSLSSSHSTTQPRSTSEAEHYTLDLDRNFAADEAGVRTDIGYES